MDLGTVSTKRYLTGVGILLVLLFTVLRPVAVAELNLLLAFLFWVIHIGVLLPLLVFTQVNLQSFSIFDRLNPWLKTAISGSVAALFFVPIGLIVDYGFAIDDWTGIANIPAFFAIFWEEVQGLVPVVALTWVGINAPRILKLNFNKPVSSESPKSSLNENRKTGLFHLMAPALGNDIIYLCSELHYLRVVTIKGEDLVLYNLKDAIHDLSGHVDGFQTHRSYWVARKHIQNITKQGSAKQINLTGDYAVPLSRRKSAMITSFLTKNAGAMQ